MQINHSGKAGKSTDAHNIRGTRAETLTTAETPGTLTAERNKATVGATEALETNGTSGDANGIKASSDGNTLNRRDFKHSRETAIAVTPTTARTPTIAGTPTTSGTQQIWKHL
jgi:hypothetical protein